MTDLRRITRALISVSDKTGLIEFARGLASHGVELVSTGGTAKAIKDAGLKVMDVSELTGFPEMMDGRVKTLHPKVHGGLLAIRDNKEHAAAMGTHGIRPIDLLVVNLYPFEATVAKGAGYDDCIENIDIGGPAMIRAAAKNHADVAVVVEPEDYAAAARRAFARTAARPRWRCARSSPPRPMPAPRAMTRRSPTGSPRSSTIRRRRSAPSAASSPRRCATARTRTRARRSIARRSSAPASPPRGRCRASSSPTTTSTTPTRPMNASPSSIPSAPRRSPSSSTPTRAAWRRARASSRPTRKALACDSTSAFGGIVALNRTLDAEAARAITEIFTEVIIAPDATDEAIKIVAAKKNLRLLLAGGLPDPRADGLTVKSVAGGLLVQSRDNATVDEMQLKTVTKRAPTAAELDDLRFAFRVAKHVKSNTIVYAKDRATVGIGAGQMSRIDAARIAARKAEDAAKELKLAAPLTKGSVVASDAFFPFADGLLVAIEAGATAVIQPGGSVRDDEVIKAADDHDVAMVLTGTRHFRH